MNWTDVARMRIFSRLTAQEKVLVRAWEYGRVFPMTARERQACKRLEARGVFVPAIGQPDIWKMNPEARK